MKGNSLVRLRLVHKPLATDRRKFFLVQTKQALAANPHLKQLQKRLLRMGGLQVVLWNGNNDPNFTEGMLQEGASTNGRKAKLKPGQPSRCHDNALDICRKDPSRFAWCTGFALSNDGIWRPHSWVLDTKAATIIETTVRREVYFGLVVNAKNFKFLTSGRD